MARTYQEIQHTHKDDDSDEEEEGEEEEEEKKETPSLAYFRDFSVIAQGLT